MKLDELMEHIGDGEPIGIFEDGIGILNTEIASEVEDLYKYHDYLVDTIEHDYEMIMINVYI